MKEIDALQEMLSKVLSPEMVQAWRSEAETALHKQFIDKLLTEPSSNSMREVWEYVKDCDEASVELLLKLFRSAIVEQRAGVVALAAGVGPEHDDAARVSLSSSREALLTKICNVIPSFHSLRGRPEVVELLVQQLSAELDAAMPAGSAAPKPVMAAPAEGRRSPTAASREDVSLGPALFEMIQREFAAALSSGKLTSAQRLGWDALLGELGTAFGDSGADLKSIMLRTHRIGELNERIAAKAARPSSLPPPEYERGSRAEKLQDLRADLEIYLHGQVRKQMHKDAQPRGDRPEHSTPAGLPLESDAVLALFFQSKALRDELSQVADASAAIELERVALRPFAAEVKKWCVREHLMLVHPVWRSDPKPQSANEVFYSGGQDVERLLLSACSARGLDLTGKVVGKNHAQGRWDALRTSHVAVFDLTQHKPRLWHASPDSASHVASVAYELGIALAIGKPVVVVCAGGAKLPFDVDIVPVELNGAASDAPAVGDAVDDAIYRVQRASMGSSVAGAVEHLRSECNKAAQYPALTMSMLNRETQEDAFAARAIIEQALRELPLENVGVTCSAWPGSFPERGRRRLFHVMPFGATWSDAVSSTVRQACGRVMDYVRGDHPLEPQVLQSIWNELSRAHCVLVDVTELNPNVALELGWSHTLGRATWVIGQEGVERHLFESIRGMRMLTYRPDDGGQSLRSVMHRVIQATVASKA